MNKILSLAETLRESNDPIMNNLATTLSTRQLLRIGHRISVYSSVSQCNTFVIYLRYVNLRIIVVPPCCM